MPDDRQAFSAICADCQSCKTSRVAGGKYIHVNAGYQPGYALRWDVGSDGRTVFAGSYNEQQSVSAIEYGR